MDITLIASGAPSALAPIIKKYHPPAAPIADTAAAISRGLIYGWSCQKSGYPIGDAMLMKETIRISSSHIVNGIVHFAVKLIKSIK